MLVKTKKTQRQGGLEELEVVGLGMFEFEGLRRAARCRLMNIIYI